MKRSFLNIDVRVFFNLGWKKSAVMGLASLFVSVSNAAVIYVNDDATGTNDGSAWHNAFVYLQDALATAVSGDTILIASGVYYPDEGTAGLSTVTNNDPTASFVIPAGVTISGGWSGSLVELNDATTVLSGDIDQNDVTNALGVVESDPSGALNGTNSYHVVTLSSGSQITLSGLTITAGWARDSSNLSGGGVLADGAEAVLENCTFSGNRAGYDGGGILFKNGSGPLMLTNCVLAANRAVRGGAASVNMSSATYENCQVFGNFGDRSAGLFSENGQITVQNCAITGNLAYDGTALFHQGGSHTLTAVNTLISGNRAIASSSIWMNSGTASFINCTVSGNQADQRTGGLLNLGSNTSTVYNCIFYNNSVGGQTDVPASSVSNEVGAASLIAYSLIENSGSSTNWNTAVGIDAGNNLDGDPLFADGLAPASAPSTEGDFQLTAQSIALDAGTNGVNTLLLDLNGKARFYGLQIDLGAYEFDPGFDLAVGAVASPEELKLNADIYYTINVSNLSDMAIGEVVVTNTFSVEIERLVFSSPVEGDFTNSQVVVKIPALPIQGVEQVLFGVEVASNVVDSITNSVTLVNPGVNDPDPSNNQQIVVTTLADTDLDGDFDFVDPDDDNDGVSDADEQTAGTDQFEAASFFSVALENPFPGIYEIRFASVFDRVYQLQSTTSLTNSFWQDEGPMIFGDNVEHTVPVSYADLSRFYRVQVTSVVPGP